MFGPAAAEPQSQARQTAETAALVARGAESRAARAVGVVLNEPAGRGAARHTLLRLAAHEGAGLAAAADGRARALRATEAALATDSLAVVWVGVRGTHVLASALEEQLVKWTALAVGGLRAGALEAAAVARLAIGVALEEEARCAAAVAFARVLVQNEAQLAA